MRRTYKYTMSWGNLIFWVVAYAIAKAVFDDGIFAWLICTPIFLGGKVTSTEVDK